MTADSHATQAQRIAEIAQRAQQATKGPWKAKTAAGNGRCGGIAPDYHNHEDGDCYDSDEPCPATQEIVTTDSGYYGPSMADAEFIAHAREDVPYLLAALRAAEARADEAAHERDVYVKAFACCEVHTPELWEGDGTCVICEAVNDFDKLRAAEQERDALLPVLRRAEQAIHSEYCTSTKCNPECRTVTEAADALAAKLAEHDQISR